MILMTLSEGVVMDVSGLGTSMHTLLNYLIVTIIVKFEKRKRELVMHTHIHTYTQCTCTRTHTVYSHTCIHRMYTHTHTHNVIRIQYWYTVLVHTHTMSSYTHTIMPIFKHNVHTCTCITASYLLLVSDSRS